ncbi:hypothetical protein [Acaryochloris marina]|uniref:Uncharacterized protein n=1 Tax=Acaryochloris marina (strain MBIC 11017) TaxID=329726 RepID=B0C487_ACAM1|nr:hypothetical protein [Acaryochloris marina]ABW27478.1 hypothetical protein AM1_2470 [Acaryochloris marina MBIC11017]BDM82214.1 hypothetical protein AM10699_50780 [Acaryochloris marina MBIC10699]
MSLNLARFRLKLKYKHIGFASEIQTDLAKLEDRVQQAQARHHLYNYIARFAWIGLIGSFVFGVFGSVLLEQPLSPLFWLFLFSLGVLLVLGILKLFERPWLIPKERYMLPLGLIKKVIRDMELEPSLHLSLNCSPVIAKRKRIDTIPDPKRDRWKIDRYADPWLLLEGQFLDQTVFTLTLTELYIEKHGWKRSRSGKTKHKRKSKPKGLSLTLTLRFQRKKYGAVTVLKDSLKDALELPPTARVKRIKVSDRTLSLTVKMPPYPPLKRFEVDQNVDVKQVEELITQMFLSLYHVLNLAQKLSKVTL